MIVTVLGSGTSTGVPVPGCNCRVCTSTDPRNSRFRTSIVISTANRDSSTQNSLQPSYRNIVVDTGPDLRSQVLTFGVKRVDAVLYTHTHADHIFGLDDLRSYNFLQHSSIPLYAGLEHQDELRRIFRYAFEENVDYAGGALPNLELHDIAAYRTFELFGLSITPLPLAHGLSLTYGFRINDFAYLTDCSGIPQRSKEHLFGLKCMIIDGLRERPHRTHFNHDLAVEQINLLRPERAFLIHISHDSDHTQTNAKISKMSSIPIELAYDGLELEL